MTFKNALFVKPLPGTTLLTFDSCVFRIHPYVDAANPCWTGDPAFHVKKKKKPQYSWIIIPLVQAGAANHRHRAEKAQLETDGGIGPNRNDHKEGGAAEQGYENNNLQQILPGDWLTANHE